LRRRVRQQGWLQGLDQFGHGFPIADIQFVMGKVFMRGQQAALLMLAQAERDARAKGYAVAIGHPYPETIAALDAWKLRRDKRVQLATLSALLKGN